MSEIIGLEQLENEMDEYINAAEFADNEIIAHLLSMDFGTPEIFQTETADHLLIRLDVLEREEVFDEYRDMITIELKADEFDDMLNDNAQRLLDTVIVVNQSALNRYNPRRFIDA